MHEPSPQERVAEQGEVSEAEYLEKNKPGF